MNIETKFR